MTRAIVCTLLAAAAAHAQGEWTTARGDAQRTAWVRTDKKISTEALEKGGFELLWKMKLGEPLMEPVLVNNIIGYRGFKALALIGGGAGDVFAVDADLAQDVLAEAFRSAASHGVRGVPGRNDSGSLTPDADGAGCKAGRFRRGCCGGRRASWATLGRRRWETRRGRGGLG